MTVKCFLKIANILLWLEMVIVMMNQIIYTVTLMAVTVVIHVLAKHFAQIVYVSLEMLEKSNNNFACPRGRTLHGVSFFLVPSSHFHNNKIQVLPNMLIITSTKRIRTA